MDVEVRDLKMTEKLVGLVDRQWRNATQSREAGKLVAWCSGSCPAQLLKAMDISVVYPESFVAFCAMGGISIGLCERANSHGYSPDLCSVARCFDGLTNDFPEEELAKLPYGGLPKPDLLVCQPYCPGIYKSWKRFSEMFDIPLLLVERPRMHDSLTRDEVAQLVRGGAAELKEMIGFLQKFTGRRFDYDRLSEMLKLELEASILWQDALRMCKNFPSPMSAFDSFMHLYVLYLYKGEPEAVTYYQELKLELAERIAGKTGSIAAEEKYRLYWHNLPIFYKKDEHAKKFASYGAVPIVATLPFDLGFKEDLDPANPLETITELLTQTPGTRGLTGRIESIMELVENYSIDGFVMQRSRTCQLQSMGDRDIMESLIKRTGLPAVVVEGDICDSRFYSDAEFNNRIEGFMEIMNQRGRQRQ